MVLHQRKLNSHPPHVILCEVISLSCLASFATQNTPPTSNFVVGTSSNHVDYRLMRQPQHIKYPFAHIKSPSKSDSVLYFLRQSGFSITQMKRIVSGEPKISLCKRGENFETQVQYVAGVAVLPGTDYSSAVQG